MQALQHLYRGTPKTLRYVPKLYGEDVDLTGKTLTFVMYLPGDIELSLQKDTPWYVEGMVSVELNAEDTEELAAGFYLAFVLATIDTEPVVVAGGEVRLVDIMLADPEEPLPG